MFLYMSLIIYVNLSNLRYRMLSSTFSYNFKYWNHSGVCFTLCSKPCSQMSMASSSWFSRSSNLEASKNTAPLFLQFYIKYLNWFLASFLLPSLPYARAPSSRILQIYSICPSEFCFTDSIRATMFSKLSFFSSYLITLTNKFSFNLLNFKLFKRIELLSS